MNKTELIAALADEMESSKPEAKTWLETFQSVVTAAVVEGDPVTITGFCKFARVERAARMGRNPATGEAIKIKASSKVRITPLKAFKDTVLASRKPKSKR